MEFSICFETAVGDSLLLMTGTLHPQLIPNFALKFAEVKRFVPGLTLVIAGHTLNELVFERGNCRLRGEPVVWHEWSKEG